MFNLRRFISDRSGSINILFAAALVPMLAGAGTAVDYSRAAGMRAKMQSAADSAALALAKVASAYCDADLKAMAERIVDGALAGNRGFTRQNVTVTRDGKRLSVTLEGTIEMSLMKVAGIRSVPLAAGSQATWGTKRVEVALVLDNTGSMSGTKITELRRAATNLVDTLARVASEPDSVKIGLVPFAKQVRVDTSLRDQPWVDLTANRGVNRNNWDGCLEDRDQPYDTNDDMQRTSALDNAARPHPAVQCSADQLARVAPLTSDFASLRTSISSMQAQGSTNLTIGLAWGLALLSPGAPMTGGAAFGTADTEKFMILLTDGDNTDNRWSMPAAQIDARTRQACDTVKSPSKNVKLYTIRVIDGNATLLRDCATSPAYYKDVRNATELNGVFQAIAAEISANRLSM